MRAKLNFTKKKKKREGDRDGKTEGAREAGGRDRNYFLILDALFGDCGVKAQEGLMSII